MDNQVKLGAVLIGGYLLGRTKKGGMALRLATRMALSGSEVDPRALMRDNAVRVIQSNETAKLVDQLRSQIMQAAQAAVEARVTALAKNLTDRTEALTSGATDTA